MIPIVQLSVIIKSLIISNQSPTTIEQLQRDFRENEGYPLPLYGYRNTQELLTNELGHAVKVFGSGPKAIVKAVLNSKTQHIHNLVSEQHAARTTRRPKKKQQTIANSFRYANNFPTQYSGSQHSYPTAWQMTRSSQPQYMSCYSRENNALLANYFGNGILGNPTTAWQVSGNQKSRQDWGREYWRKNTYQSNSNGFHSRYEHTARNTNFCNKNANIRKSTKTEHHYYEKRSLDLSHNVSSNNTGNHSQFKEKSYSICYSFTNSGRAYKADTNNKKRQASFTNNISYGFDSKDATPKYASHSRVMPLEHKHGPRRENLNKSFKSKNVDYVEHWNDCDENLKTPSKVNQKNTQNLQVSNEKTFENGCDSDTLHNDLNMLSLYEDCNKRQNKLQNNNKNLETLPTCGPNKSTLIHTDSSLPSLIFSVTELSDISPVDSDEAVPDFAITNRVFSLDFPENTVPYGTQIEPFQIPDHVQVDSIISIYISEIHNPFRFWFHYAVDALDELMNNIELFYAQDDLAGCYKLLPEQIQRGQICVALYNGAWHRAEILSTIIADKVKVYYLDYGTVGDVPPDDLMYLHMEFSQERAYACRGSLAEINPMRLHWSTESTIAFLGMVKNRKLHAKICEVDTKNRVYYLQIVDSHTEPVIHINRELIKMKHATKSYEWAKYKLTGTSRQRSRREEYPPFEMLEDGNYPTFAEIYSMEINGINYEDITDKMIYHPSIVNISDLNRSSFLLLSNNPFKEDILKQLVEETKLM